MALDMDQLVKLFYEECRDNLEVLENVLLSLNPENVDKEQIDTIFRAAHSIKGGAGTFNLLEISEFTHKVEAYLDNVRNDELSLTPSSIDILLKSCDCIRLMLEAHEAGESADTDIAEKLAADLAALISKTNADDIAKQNETTSDTNVDEISVSGDWSVNFVPHQSLFFSGNDPLRILRELRELDENVQIICQHEPLPEVAEIDPELCYVSWNIQLASAVEKTDIEEIFEWVLDECELTIERLSDQTVVSESPVSDSQQIINASAELTPKNEEPAKAPAEKQTKVVKAETTVTSIRVDIDKVDNLINLVGELVITQSMLTEISNDFSVDKLDKLKAGLEQLLQNSRDLQENVLNIRMLPMSFAFSRFPRLVRDLTNRLQKDVDLVIQGEHTELDKTVLERIVDPLVHLVRNGIDHGIELPEQRVAAGKDPRGVLTLNAFHEGGSIIIQIKDDGAGIDCDKLWQKAVSKGVLAADARREDMSDKQVLNLIFAPGFSTADVVSDISGRGVGMDVVRRNIEELGGHINVESILGVGSEFTISLPLTLAILDGQLVRVAGEVYVIPLLTIMESIQIDPSCIKHASGGVELYRLREDNIPILRLREEFAMGESGDINEKILCFVEAAGNRVGLLLDELLDQQQVVIKSLESNYTKVAGISGATILGDGSVSLILDIQGLITSFLKRNGENSGIAA